MATIRITHEMALALPPLCNARNLADGLKAAGITTKRFQAWLSNPSFLRELAQAPCASEEDFKGLVARTAWATKEVLDGEQIRRAIFKAVHTAMERALECRGGSDG